MAEYPHWSEWIDKPEGEGDYLALASALTDEEWDALEEELADEEGEDSKGVRVKAAGRIRAEQAEKRFQSELAAYFKAQGRAVVRAYGRSAKAAQRDDLIGPEWDEELHDLALEFYSDTAALVAGDVGASLGMPNLAELAAERYGATVERLAEKITGINETTRADIARIIEDGLTAGQHPTVIARAIRGEFAEMGKSRAETIARTETANVMNLSAIDAYEASGVVTAVKVLDGDYDPECSAANGQTWTFDQAREQPIAHPRCTRALSPVVGVA
jgi:SPP1 gp7 family putative phage head morphogenesis protein